MSKKFLCCRVLLHFQHSAASMNMSFLSQIAAHKMQLSHHHTLTAKAKKTTATTQIIQKHDVAPPIMEYNNGTIMEWTTKSMQPNVLFDKTRQLFVNIPKIIGTTSNNESKFGSRVFNYVEEVSHMDQVRKAQAYVLHLNNQLRDASEKKRVILRNLDNVHNKLQHIYKDMKFNQNRVSDEYLQLVKQELNLYTEEKSLQEAFKQADQAEQILFNKFSLAITDSYEKEKLHTNFVKVLGIIGTILASFLTLIATIIGVLYNQNKFYTLRQDVEETFTRQVTAKLEKINEEIRALERKQNHKPSSESWGSYLKRHTRWTYSWALPKK